MNFFLAALGNFSGNFGNQFGVTNLNPVDGVLRHEKKTLLDTIYVSLIVTGDLN